jgi:hypothetical protein
VGRLFLTRMELTALAVLLTDLFGWNLAVYDRMPAPVRTPSVGETAMVTYQVQVEKRRRGGGHWFSTENITDSGASSSGRLITQALEATAWGRALAARLAPGTDFLMTARALTPGRPLRDLDRARPVGPLVFGISRNDPAEWSRRHNLGGSPFLRVRRTTVAREGRPLQHARGTHESVYVLPNPHLQHASRQVFEDGAYEALEQARAAVFGGHLAEAPDPAHQQTATADCADEAASPWPSPDGAARRTSCSAWAARTRTSTPATTRAWRTSTSRSPACGPPCPIATGPPAGTSTCCGWKTCGTRRVPPSGTPPWPASPRPTASWSATC